MGPNIFSMKEKNIYIINKKNKYTVFIKIGIEQKTVENIS